MRKSIKFLIRLLLFQFLIIICFVAMYSNNQPLDSQDIHEIEITIEDIAYKREFLESRLSISSNSVVYSFSKASFSSEHSIGTLKDSLSIGEHLSLMYYEEQWVQGKTNWIVDARTETDVYCSLSSFQEEKRAVSIAVCILFAIIEMLFLAATLFYFFLHDRGWFA